MCVSVLPSVCIYMRVLVCAKEMDGEGLEVEGEERSSPRHQLRGNRLVMEEMENCVSREIPLGLGGCTYNVCIYKE